MRKVIQVVLSTVVTVGLCGPAAADLCEKCRGKAYITSVGECSACGGQTTSGAFKLCKKCSAEQGRCEHCLALLDPGKRPPEKKARRPKPIDPNKPGTYSFGKWKYSLTITAPGTRSEGRWGQLLYDGKKLPIPEVNDYHRTPWGMIYWVGDPRPRWGEHGWLSSPSPRVKRKGKLLPAPDAQAQELKLTAADNGKTAATEVGKTVVISLEGNITTGYRWQTAELSGKAVEPIGKPSYVTRPHQPGMVGVGGTFVFKFKAARPGKAAVKLVYVRPWEKDKPPERTFAATIEVRAVKKQPPGGRSPGKKPPAVRGSEQAVSAR